jgi:hypothetical protein
MSDGYSWDKRIQFVVRYMYGELTDEGGGWNWAESVVERIQSFKLGLRTC